MSGNIKLTLIIFFGGLFILSLLGVLWFFSSGRPPQTNTVPTPTLTPLSPPVTGFVPNEPVAIFSYGNALAPPPTSLPVYKTEIQPDMSARLDQFATSLGLSNPIVFSQAGSVKKSWSNDQYVLAYASGQGTQTVSYQRLGPDKPNAATPDESARAFLFSLASVSPDALDLLSQKPQDAHSLVFKDQPRLMLLLYASVVNRQYPLLISNFDQTSAAVVIDQNNTVRSLSLTVPPTSLQQEGVRQTLTLAGALQALNDRKGMLVSVVGNSSSAAAPKPEFSSVIIRRLTLAYWLDPQTKEALPVYLFDGVGAASGGSQQVQYMVRATQ